MSTADNKALARRHYEAHNDLKAAFELIAPEVVFHALAGVPPTYDGWYNAHAMFVSAFPDMHLTVEDQIAEGDRVVTRWTMHGTHQGELMGIPPTGKAVTISGTSIDRLAGGKVAEHWAEFDLLGLMQQLGVIPTPAPAAA